MLLKNKKILVLSHMFPSKVHSYLGNQIYERVMELSKRYDVRVVAPIPFAPSLPKWLNPYHEYTLIPKEEVVNGVKVYHPRYFTFPGLFLYSLDALTYYIGCVKIIREMFGKWKFDLIDSHQAFPDGFVSTRVASQLIPRPKVVVTVHGADVHTSHRALVRRWVILAALKSSDLVMAVSNSVRNRIESLIGGAKVVVVPIGIQVPAYLPRLPLAIQKKIKGKFVILTVGNLLKTKGQIYVIKAIQRLCETYKSIFLLVVGDGPELECLQKFVQENGLDNNVHFVGAVPHSQVLSYYKSADVFVLPSWVEALGIVYMEAMMFGKPAIGCESEGAKELITNIKDGFLVAPKDSEQIAICLRKLIDSPKLLNEMGKAARDKAMKSFQFKDRINEVCKQFDILLGP